MCVSGALPPSRHIALYATRRRRLLKPSIRLSLLRLPCFTVFFLLLYKIEIDRSLKGSYDRLLFLCLKGIKRNFTLSQTRPRGNGAATIASAGAGGKKTDRWTWLFSNSNILVWYMGGRRILVSSHLSAGVKALL